MRSRLSSAVYSGGVWSGSPSSRPSYFSTSIGVGRTALEAVLLLRLRIVDDAEEVRGSLPLVSVEPSGVDVVEGLSWITVDVADRSVLDSMGEIEEIEESEDSIPDNDVSETT